MVYTDNQGLVIVRDAHLTMLNNSIQLCLDNRPNRYEVPVFCINEPINYSSETLAEKFLNFEYDDVEFQVMDVLYRSKLGQ